MFDGVVRTIADIRHVPNLKRNLISLGTLNARGYRYTSQGGALKVSKGATVVLKREIISGGLYRRVGNVHMGGTTGRACTSNSSRRKIIRRKQAMFASLVKCGNDQRRLS